MDMTLPTRSHHEFALGGIGIGPEVDWIPEPQAPNSWHEHVPFALWLVKALCPRIIVELGQAEGAPYAAFCLAVERLGLATRCFAVERGAEPSDRPHESATRIGTGRQDGGSGAFSTVLRMRPEEARAHFASGEVDLLHIGGGESHEAVANAFQLWRETLSDRGVVLFHDINLPDRRRGGWKLWRELQATHPHFEFLHGNGLGVLGLGAALPAPVAALFAAGVEPEETLAIRRFFAARGEALHDRFLVHALETRVAVAEETGFAERAAALAERDEARSRAQQAVAERDRLAADWAAAQTERDAILADAQQARALREAMLRSTSWRITRPLRVAVGLARREPNYVAQVKRVLGRAVPVPTPCRPGRCRSWERCCRRPRTGRDRCARLCRRPPADAADHLPGDRRAAPADLGDRQHQCRSAFSAASAPPRCWRRCWPSGWMCRCGW